ncbi:alanine:cation symporter family protein [Escherichia coli]
MNIGQLPHVIWSIFESAFGWQDGRRRGGIYLKPAAITNGFQRSTFSNEAMGSTPTRQRQRRPGLRIRQRKGLSR